MKSTIPSLAGLPKKFKKEEDAKEFAKAESKRLKKILYVIQAREKGETVVYVDASGFIRLHETLLWEYENGFLL